MVKHLKKVNPYVIASLAPWLVFEIKQERNSGPKNHSIIEIKMEVAKDSNTTFFTPLLIRSYLFAP